MCVSGYFNIKNMCLIVLFDTCLCLCFLSEIGFMKKVEIVANVFDICEGKLFASQRNKEIMPVIGNFLVGINETKRASFET